MSQSEALEQTDPLHGTTVQVAYSKRDLKGVLPQNH